MFMIIEFLARRKSTRTPDQLYRMNMYMTIPEEIGVFHSELLPVKDDLKPETMAEEDKIFKSLNVAFAPDNNIDEILECLWNKLKSKIG